MSTRINTLRGILSFIVTICFGCSIGLLLYATVLEPSTVDVVDGTIRGKNAVESIMLKRNIFQTNQQLRWQNQQLQLKRTMTVHIEQKRNHRHWNQINSTIPPQTSSNDTFGFVHIGKTGGSTISKLLRNGCHSFISSDGASNAQKPCRTNISNETIVSKLVERYYHVPDFWWLPETYHRAYLLSVRDPYERTISSFVYNHPENFKYYNITSTKKQREFGPIAYECFPSVEILVSLVKNKTKTTSESIHCNYPHPPNTVDASNCVELACANILYSKLPVATSKTKATEQWFYKQQRTMYVIRQEYLWHDWYAINKLLSRREANDDSSLLHVQFDKNINERNVSKLFLPVTRDLSYEGRNILCKFLTEEYIAYFELLQMAVNIDKNEMERSIRTSLSKCRNLDINYIVQAGAKGIEAG